MALVVNSIHRPDSYDSVLSQLHIGGWFTFNKDGKAMPHTYENLVIIPDKDGVTHDKPTENYLDTELAKLQALWDADDYSRKRRQELDGYPTVGKQLDMIYHDQVNSTTTFKDAIKAVKDKYPKS